MFAASLLTLALCAVSAPQASSEPVTQWVVGAPAPHIHLPEISSGAAIDLARYRGKKVLLVEFASW